MNAIQRPVSITIVACLYIAVGAIGFVFHLRETLESHAYYSGALIELTEAIALVSGVFLLRGQSWARWLALAWMAFHVVISAFDAWPKLAMHAVLCVVIGSILFRPAAGRYFRGTPPPQVQDASGW